MRGVVAHDLLASELGHPANLTDRSRDYLDEVVALFPASSGSFEWWILVRGRAAFDLQGVCYRRSNQSKECENKVSS
jgi:hypothetical protein